MGFFSSEKGELHQKHLSSGAKHCLKHRKTWDGISTPNNALNHQTRSIFLWFSKLDAASRLTATHPAQFCRLFLSLCVSFSTSRICDQLCLALGMKSHWIKKKAKKLSSAPGLHLAGPWTLSKVFLSLPSWIAQCSIFFRLWRSCLWVLISLIPLKRSPLMFLSFWKI